MKKSITFVVATAILSLMITNIYCKPKTKKAKQPETSRVLAVFLNPDSTDANYDILWRVVKDSIMIDTNDVSKNKVFHDTLYYLEKRDTARDGLGNPRRDSLNNILLNPVFLYIPKTSVWDTKIVVDSARKKFDPFIKKRDSTAKK